MPTLNKPPPKKRTYYGRRHLVNGSNPYDSVRWKTMRKKLLHMYPLCMRCQHHGKVRAARIVDHIHPWEGNADKFYHNEFQTLCHECHSWKTSQEQRGKIYSWLNQKEIILAK